MNELEKIRKVEKESLAISEFLDWLDYNRLVICKLNDSGIFYSDRTTKERMLADFFNIDLKKAEQERCDILKQLRGMK